MKEIRAALKYTFPILFTYVFLGIAFGIMMNDAGYGILLTTLSAVFIYAGSMQIVMVPMLVSGASLITLAMMTFFINARHIFYGLGFVERFRKMGRRYPYMILTLTDETYSVLCGTQIPKELDENRTTFLIAMMNHLYWITGCFLGGCAGQYLKIDLTGIDFSATAFFLVVVVSQWKQYGTKAPFLTAAVCSMGFLLLLGPDLFLIPTLCCCLIALLMMRKKLEAKEENDHE